jgi:AcrR family transcriptional regulator
VLHAALHAISANGYNGSSLSEIAADAGLTTAGLLHHFPSKEHLLIAVLAERDRLDAARFQLGELQGLGALDRLVQLVEHNSQRREVVTAFTVLMGESTSDEHPGRSWFEYRYPRRRENLAKALQAGIGRREIRADVDCAAYATEIIAVMDGLQVQWAFNPDQVDMVAVFTHYVRSVRESLALPSGSA